MGTALVPPPSAFLRSPTCPWQVALQQSLLLFRPARQIWHPGKPHVRPNAVLYKPTHLKRGSLQSQDTYGEVQLNKSTTGYEIIYYSHGKRIGSKLFDSYDRVLRYLVYERLTNVSDKYKDQIKRSYYT